MRPSLITAFAATLALLPALATSLAAQDANPRLEALKVEALELVESRAKLVQVMVDKLFSFGELGMQEFETQRYLTGLLEDNGFEIELGVAGMPSAWIARWGSGGPLIAMGSDVDGIPQSNQKPGVAYRDPILSMAPGHGEGHNSGQAVNIVAALAVKEIMERDNIPGRLLIWPGIAEEQLGSKAFFVRDGVFDGVDVNLFTHVSNNFGMVPVRFSVGKQEEASSRKLSDWIVKEAKLPEVAIGEIEVNDAESIVEVHVDRVETVLKVMGSRDWNGHTVKAEIAN